MVVTFDPRLVVIVVNAVAGELGAVGGTVFGDVEGGGAVLGAEGVLDGGDDTLDIVVTLGLGTGFQLAGLDGCSLRVERIGLGTVTLRRIFTAGLDTAAAFTVDGIDISAGGLRSVALEVHDLGADNDFVAGGEFLAAQGPSLVVKVLDTVSGKGGRVAFVHQGEGSIAVLGIELIGHSAHLTLNIVFGFSSSFTRLDGLGNGSRHVERIVQGTLALRLGAFATAAATFVTALVHAVQAVQEGCILGGLGGVALVVHNLTVNDDVVAHFNLGVSVGELLVAQVQHAIGGELRAGGFAVVGDDEGTVTVLGGVGLGDGADLTRDVYVLGAGDIGTQLGHVVDDTGHVEGLGLGTVTVVHFAFGTHLAHRKGGTGEADGEGDGCITVVSLVLRDGEGDGLGSGVSGTAFLAQGNPVRQTGDGPVARSSKGNILGGDDRLGECHVGGIHFQLGGTQVHFLVTAGQESCTGDNCQNKVSEFHVIIVLLLIIRFYRSGKQ